MKIAARWGQKMQFTADSDGQVIAMDAKAPFGEGKAPTPKELLLAAICGCTGMDVVGLLKKHKQPVDSFSVEAESKVHEGHPAVFTDVELAYRLTGAIDRKVLIESIQLSQTKYCSVSAMVSKAVPIRYQVFLNSEPIHSGSAKFE